MPEGKTIPFVEGEYPQLDGIQDGAQVSFSGKATKQGSELVIDVMNFETENAATRELKSMTKQPAMSGGSSSKSLADNF